jgi:hypothetical protein
MPDPRAVPARTVPAGVVLGQEAYACPEAVGTTTASRFRLEEVTMEAADDTGRAAAPATEPGVANPGTTPASPPAGDRPFGPDAAAILATEHWSLLGTRSLLWNEAMSRTTVFLTVLSASIIALALLADATGFGSQTTTLALVLLPVVLFLGTATYVRLVQINTEEIKTVLAMNRLRHAYLKMAPGLEPYFTTGHHDDASGLATTYLLAGPSHLHPWVHFLVTTPTIVATVNAAVAAAIVVLVLQTAELPRAAGVAGGTAAFLAVWGSLYVLQRHNLHPLRHTKPRFPTPPARSAPRDPT